MGSLRTSRLGEITLDSWGMTVTTQGPQMEGEAGEGRQDRSSEEEQLESDRWSPASGSRDLTPHSDSRRERGSAGNPDGLGEAALPTPDCCLRPL